MPNDLVIRPVAPASPDPAAGLVIQGTSAAPASGISADTMPNPSLRLDPTLGLVVIEFHNKAGGLTHSIPGERQLDAYRAARQLSNEPDPLLCADPHLHPSATRTV